MPRSDADLQRRSFLKWASSVGLTTVAPGTVAAIAGAEESEELPVEPDDPERDGDVTVTHPAEYSGVRERVSAAHDTGDYTEKCSRRLRQWLEARAESGGYGDHVDLHVRTVGEPATVVTERYGRQYDGWTPTYGELTDLESYGDVQFAPDFLSTKVSVADVHADDDLPDLLAEDRVLTAGFHGPRSGSYPFDLGDTETERTHTSQEYQTVASDDLRGSDLLGFEDVDEVDALTSGSVKVGVVDTGYQDEPSLWNENHAEPYLDEALADEFAPGWDETSEYHGTIVANTLAYCLGDGWDEMIVPLYKSSGRFETDADGIRAAIEFAARHDIEVLNLSQGVDGAERQHCQSALCDELAGYVAGGNVPVASAGNDGDGEVTEAAASLYDVGVGGIHGRECSDAGYWIDQDCSLSDPARYGDDRQCEVCASRDPDGLFAPDVFGVMTFGDGEDAQSSTTGSSSFAAPQFAAAAALLKEHGLDSYWDVKDAARAQDRTNVCPDDHAKAGQLFHANDVLGHAPPTPPGDPRVEWVSDTAVELSWDPSHSPGEPDVYIYFVTYSAGGNGQSWYVYAPETSIVIDGLVDGQSYDVTFSAADDWGNESELPGPEVTFSTTASEDLVASINPEQTELSAGETARFDWTDETDDDHWVAEAPHWDFDDGATETDWYAEHTYDEPGTYWVTMEATNDEGRTTTAFVELTVS